MSAAVETKPVGEEVASSAAPAADTADVVLAEPGAAAPTEAPASTEGAPGAAGGESTAVIVSASASEGGAAAAAAAFDGTSAEARDAFAKRDADASRAIHDKKSEAGRATEKHGGAGSDYIKSIVFGGLDGIITTFAIVAAVAGAGLKIEVVMLMGFANLIADGISMGLGDYLSEKAEMDSIIEERKREAWEYENYPEGEKAEMVDLYVEKGFDRDDAEKIIEVYTSKPKYADMFVDHMMIEELGQQVPDPDDSPLCNGLITFASFVIFGSVPMWIYVIFYAAGNRDPEVQFGVTCGATALTMFGLGFFKARIVKQDAVKSGVLMMLNGSLAAASAYLIGWGLEAAFGDLGNASA